MSEEILPEETKRILIVDDEESIVEILNEAVSTEGYKTETAFSADEAFHKIKSFQPHLVITDNDMPGLSGLDMLKELRSQDNYVTVIFVSGRTDANYVVQALKAGADDYIRKPFRMNELIARIETTLRHNTSHRDLFEANLKLQDMVDKDYLTGLYNMRTMYEKIDFELKRAKRFDRQIACVMLDMDKFKRVNDDHDHLFGTFVIKEIGEMIKSNIREIDFGARYGGDEFLIVLTETHSEGARIFCERLRKIVESHTFKKDKDSIDLTVSIGFAINTTDIDARQLVRNADHALYKAKENGRNRVEEFEPH